MHQFPAWKYWLVAIVLALSVFLALPNVFGEGPALQLTRNDRQNFDAAGETRVQEILQSKQLVAEASYREDDRLVLRFADPAQRHAARDAIQAAASAEYLIA